MKYIVSLLILAMAGCSPSEPTQQDFEAVILTAHGFSGNSYKERACQNFTIDTVEKVNGLKIDDTTYQIALTFHRNVVPVEGYAERLAREKSDYESILQTSNEVSRELHHRIFQVDGNHLYPREEEMSEEARVIDARLKEIREFVKLAEAKLEQTRQEMLAEWSNGNDECWKMAKKLGFTEEDFYIGSTMQLQYETTLRNTDNGWVEMNF